MERRNRTFFCHVIHAFPFACGWGCSLRKPIFEMILILLVVVILLNFKVATLNAQLEPATTVRFIPSSVTVEPDQNFTLAVVVEDVVDLVGFDIQFSWNTTRLAFINHTLTVPAETYPNPMLPSPYAGILHGSPYVVKDEVNVTAGTYHCVAVDLELNGFAGDGTVAVITFQTLDKLGSTNLQFSSHELPNSEGKLISSNAADGVVSVWSIDVSVVSPVNETYSLSSLPLEFSLSKPASQVEYCLDGQANVTVTGNTTLSGLSDGPHSLRVYARDLVGNVGASNLVYFTIDATAPRVSIVSPENTTYSEAGIPLTFTVDELTEWMAYSLDGKENATISGNTTLSGLSDGVHSLVVYARDLSGNTGASSILHFTVEQERIGPEPFPVEIVAAVLVVTAATAAGLLYYVRLRRKK
jgi:hypothetical protein